MTGASGNFRRSPDSEMVRISADGTHCFEEGRTTVQRNKCLHIHAIDGYETFQIGENTIGVRPIWYDAKRNPPAPMQDVLLCIAGEVIMGWNESTQPEEEPSYCSWYPWPEGYINGEGVTYWMPLPKPP